MTEDYFIIKTWYDEETGRLKSQRISAETFFAEFEEGDERDIVDRLRDPDWKSDIPRNLHDDAAKEIESLRYQNQEFKKQLDCMLMTLQHPYATQCQAPRQGPGLNEQVPPWGGSLGRTFGL